MTKNVADIPGICGIVPGAILPGFFGVEAGQSAVGDIFKWWVEGVCGGDAALHGTLTKEAAGLEAGPERTDCPRLAQWQPHHSGRSSPDGRNDRTDAPYDPRRDLYVPLLRPRLSVPVPSSSESANMVFREAGCLRRRHCGEEFPPNADLCRHHQLHDAGGRIESGLRPRIGHFGGCSRRSSQDFRSPRKRW